jgi:hypothetical protein
VAKGEDDEKTSCEGATLAVQFRQSKIVATSRRILGFFLTHRFISALAVFGLSFLVRLAMLLYVGDIDHHGAAEAENIALALISKHQFADPFAIPTGPTAHTTPFYPFLLAGVYALFGHGYVGYLVRSLLVIGAYSLLYSLYIWLAPSFGFPEGAGLFAGFASAVLPVKRSAEVFLGWEEPYAAIALAFLLLLTFKQWGTQHRKIGTAIYLGLCWGIALYISFSLATVLLGLLVVDVLLRRSWTAIRDSLCIGLTVIVVIAPWVVRNRVEMHAWTMMRSAFGENLWCSNNDHAHPSIELVNTDPLAKKMYPINARSEATKVRDMGEVGYDRYELRLALHWIQQNPRKFANLSLLRFLYFWAGPLDHPFEVAVTISYTLLGLAGLFFIRRYVGGIQFQLWLTTLICFPVMYYFVQYVNRYRTPIDWMVWLSAGLTVSLLFARLGPKEPARESLPAREPVTTERITEQVTIAIGRADC